MRCAGDNGLLVTQSGVDTDRPANRTNRCEVCGWISILPCGRGSNTMHTDALENFFYHVCNSGGVVWERPMKKHSSAILDSLDNRKATFATY